MLVMFKTHVKVISILSAIVIPPLLGVAAGECTGLVAKTEPCTSQGQCSVVHGCDTMTTVGPNVAKCSTTSATESNNCINSSTTADCGDRFECDEECKQGAKLGDVLYYLIHEEDGGDCVVP